MGRSGRQLSTCATSRTPHEAPRAFNRARRDTGPNRTPCEMSDGHHGMRLNRGVGIRQDLLRYTRGFEHEAGAASAAHPESLPVDNGLELIVFPKQSEKNLIGGGSIG